MSILAETQNRRTMSKEKKINEPNPLTSVAEFHNMFGHPVKDQQTLIGEDRWKLRISLIQEELNELTEAFEDGDMVEIADALADLQYVLSGTILECGLQDKFKTLFDEVHRSNMSKSCSTMDEAEATVSHFKAKDGVDSHIKEVEGKFLVFRTADNKVLKSVKYSPADLKAIIEH